MARMYRILRYCNLQFADKYSKRHNYDKGRFDIWLTQRHDGLTDRKKKKNEYRDVIDYWVRSCSHSLVKPFTWLQYEMRNAKVTVWSKWRAEQCYFNHSDSVTGISVYISHTGRDIIIRLLQSIKTIVEYVVCWFLFKPPRLINLHYCTDSNKYRVNCSQKSFNFHWSTGVRSPWRNVSESTRQVILHSNHCKFFFFFMYILTLSHPILYWQFKATGGPLNKNFFSSCPETRGLLSGISPYKC